VPFHAEGELKTPIEGKPALTSYRVVAVKKGYAVVEVRPRTGRTNQIRIHFKGIGHPLLGESKYAFRKDFSIKFKRVALHAGLIELVHPVTGKKLVVEAPVPEDMKRMMEDLSF
jgi:23S rRNA-/tRNA-specific pseudouridylate synthase